MLFSTKDAKAFVNSESKYISAGIVDNIDIQEVKSAISPNKGSKYISITFSKGESTVNTTIWEPGGFSDTPEKVKEKFLKTMFRLTQIVEAYYPVGDPATECQVENFSQLSDWFINAMNNRDKSKLARAKFVYNKDGYLALPSYAKYRFIEPMDKPENWTEEPLEIFADKDVLVRPVIADAVQSTANPFKAAIVEPQTTTAPTYMTPEANMQPLQDQPKSDLPF